MRTTASSPPLVVRGRHLTDSVAYAATSGYIKTFCRSPYRAIVRQIVLPECPLAPRLFASRGRQESEHSSRISDPAHKLRKRGCLEVTGRPDLGEAVGDTGFVCQLSNPLFHVRDKYR